MSKIEIELPSGLFGFLKQQVEAGLYHSVEDAIEHAVRRLWEIGDVKTALLRAALEPGLADVDAGRFFDGTIEDMIAEARASRGTGSS